MFQKIILFIAMFCLLFNVAGAVEIEDFEQFDFTELYNEFFVSGFTNWDLLEMALDFYVNSVGGTVLWMILFITVYTALHLTTGGVSIPAAAFSAVGMILVQVLPYELSTWTYMLISIALFVLPGYKYFKN
ncbi:hypothetical protein MsAg5_13220 [Methanosarcinaceae archaeon Ag5]|uniref:Uncharacterized protein n=1 Tax=Methanolapillus africanus TaxID=3028297 RepID=A0AAE4MJ61_9EURY|nr:hypothetical protein [Methanosarcinaceae archaeon Ag5]